MTQAGRSALLLAAGALAFLLSSQAQAQSTQVADGDPQPAVTLHSREARVLFESSPDHLAIYRSSYRSVGWATAGNISVTADTHGYQRICVAPCEVSVAAGTDTLSVSKTANGESWPLPIGAVTFPAGTSRVRLDYHDRGPVRRVGGWVFLSGLVGMGYGFFEAAGYAKCGDGTCKDGKLRGIAWSGGLMLGAFAIGGIMLSVDDVVEVKVTTRSQAYTPAPPRGREVSLRGHF